MLLKRCVALGAMVLGFAAPFQVRADAQRQTLAEHLLEIMRAQGTIGEQKYLELREIAAAESKALADVAAQSDSDFRVKWKDGLVFENPAHDFSMQVGGRIQLDAAVADEDSSTRSALGLTDDEFGSGTEFRRARIYIKGQVAENVNYMAEYDFGAESDGMGDGADFRDVYIEFSDVPWLKKVKVGHFKEPFSIEGLTSSRFVTFMERGLPHLFSPARNTGIMLSGSCDCFDMPWTWALGGFRDTDDFGSGFGDSEYNVTARLTGAPIYADEGRRVLNLGFAYSHKFISNELIAYDSPPEAHLLPDYLATGDIAANGVDLLNPELSLVLGPFSLQGEYMYAAVDSNDSEDLDFHGWYTYVSYFLTGENRSYSREKGIYGRLRPKHDFSLKKKSPGAWEIAARYSHVDLDDDGILGGDLQNWTLALNWYLNPFTRIMLNYVRADLDDGGDTNIFETRFQVDF